MHSDSAISSSKEDLANRIDGKRQRSAQEAALLRWLHAKTEVSTAPSAISATGSAQSALAPRLPSVDIGKATTLRKALLAQGLDILPDPLNRFPCPKVVRAVRKSPQG